MRFMGHSISPAGLRPTAEKCPHDQYADAHGCKVGPCTDGWYELLPHSLPHVSKRPRPIKSHLRKGVNFAFTPAMEKLGRENLPELATPSTMVFPNWDAVADGSRLFHVYGDACIDRFSAAFQQKQEDGSITDIAYISRAMLDSERRWPPLGLEVGSIVWAVKRLRGYLWGTKFRIFSDHKALELSLIHI